MQILVTNPYIKKSNNFVEIKQTCNFIKYNKWLKAREL